MRRAQEDCFGPGLLTLKIKQVAGIAMTNQQINNHYFCRHNFHSGKNKLC